jgi:hypothetical protein
MAQRWVMCAMTKRLGLFGPRRLRLVDLDTAFICLGVKRMPMNMVDATGIGFDTLQPNDGRFPYRTVVPLYVRVSGEPGDNVAHVVIRLTDAEGGTIAETLNEITFHDAPNIPNDLPILGHEVFELGLTFGSPGAYALRVSLAESREIVIPIFAKAR